MSDMFFKLGPDSDSTISLSPEWDLRRDMKKMEKKHRLQNGDLYVYKTGEYDMIDAKVKFMPLSDAAIVNSWWESNTGLVYYHREKDFRDWSFTNTTDGWYTSASSTLEVSSDGILTITQNSGAGDISVNFHSSSFPGSEFYKINVLARVNSPATFYGGLYYGTYGANSHASNNSYYNITSADTSVYSDYTIITWDMRSLTLGGNDWINSEIVRIHIYLAGAGSGSMDVDYIDVGYKYSSVSSVMIRNSKKPFSKYQEPYADYMEGKIQLEGY